MPRHARFFRSGTLLHVISRFVDRDWFLTSDDERDYYLTLLGRAMQHTDWLCLAYCLMSNHLHFAMIAGEQSLESWAKRVNSPFANWLNKMRGRLGPIFADRPRTIEVPPHRALDVIAYIHNNPVRAHLVADASASTWSSHRAYVGLARAPRWLDVAEGLRRTGFATRPSEFDDGVRQLAERRAAYPEIEIAAGEPDCEHEDVPERTVGTVGLARFAPDEIVRCVSDKFELSVAQLQQPHARGIASDAKQIAVHVARAVGVTLADVASTLRFTRQRASRISSRRLSDEQCRVVDEISAKLRAGRG